MKKHIAEQIPMPMAIPDVKAPEVAPRRKPVVIADCDNQIERNLLVKKVGEAAAKDTMEIPGLMENEFGLHNCPKLPRDQSR